MDFSLSYTSQFQLWCVRLYEITADVPISTIYGIRDRSHGQTNQIVELSLKMRSDWYITSLDHIHFCLIPILEILGHGPNYEWINEWKKSPSSGMIKNKSYFVRTYKIKQIRQELTKLPIFDDLTNKYKQSLLAHSNQIMCE